MKMTLDLTYAVFDSGNVHDIPNDIMHVYATWYNACYRKHTKLKQTYLQLKMDINVVTSAVVVWISRKEPLPQAHNLSSRPCPDSVEHNPEPDWKTRYVDGGSPRYSGDRHTVARAI